VSCAERVGRGVLAFTLWWVPSGETVQERGPRAHVGTSRDVSIRGPGALAEATC
jgi:hypothetical protein